MELQNALTELGVAFAQGRQEHDALSAEISSLQGRRSNIDARKSPCAPRCARPWVARRLYALCR
jgi:uncharacterized protein YPO0396